MNALLQAALHWHPCTVQDIDALLAIEQRSYSHPWTRGNFLDSLSAAHWAWLAREGEAVRSYWLALPILDELHLLNLAVHPEHQGRGLARAALRHMREQAQAAGLREIWLEVRESNQRAQAVYEADGYARVGRRKGYYPLGNGQREDALLMRRPLIEATA